MKLVEKQKGKIILESEKKTDKYLGTIFLNDFATADAENKNGRIYKESLLEKAIADVKERMKKGEQILGSIDHPENTSGSLKSTSHEIIAFEKKGKKYSAKARILRTSSGNDLLELLKAKINVGSSLRGVGKVNSDGFVEEDSYHMESIDIVTKPSFKNVVGLAESKGVFSSTFIDNLVRKTVQKKLAERNEEKRHEILLEQFSEACDSGFTGTFEEFEEAIMKNKIEN